MTFEKPMAKVVGRSLFSTSTVFLQTVMKYFQFIVDRAKDPRFWLVSLLLIAILLFPLAALGLPLQKGYFQYFQSEELFLMNIPDLIVRALMIASLLSAIPLAFLWLRDEILFAET